MYPPRERLSAGANFVRSRMGTGWRVSMMQVGPSRFRRAYFQASTASFEISRANERDARHGPQTGEMFDRLVGGTILTQTDAVIGE